MTNPRASKTQSGKGNTKRTSGRPVDAATLILVDSSDGQTRVLMGQRRKDLAFMPGKYVFPGGRVDKADKNIVPCTALPPDESAKLLWDMKGTPSEGRARAIAMAAIRETFEESGLLIGESSSDISPSPRQEPESNTTSATTSTPTAATAATAGSDADTDPASLSWAKFCAFGYQPGLDKLTFFARAITPPGRPRRFDTRFFCADASAICHRTELFDDELSGLQWLTLEETSEFDLPGITRVILEDLTERLVNGGLAHEDQPVPYYYFLNGSFRRDLITLPER